MDYGQFEAIAGYKKITGRTFMPGEEVVIPTDALVFPTYQYVYKTLEEYKEKRCYYDVETNEWLVDLVTNVLLQPDIPPIYVDVLDDGYALVDGSHRVTAHLIAGRSEIRAQLNAV